MKTSLKNRPLIALSISCRPQAQVLVWLQPLLITHLLACAVATLCPASCSFCARFWTLSKTAWQENPRVVGFQEKALWCTVRGVSTSDIRQEVKDRRKETSMIWTEWQVGLTVDKESEAWVSSFLFFCFCGGYHFRYVYVSFYWTAQNLIETCLTRLDIFTPMIAESDRFYESIRLVGAQRWVGKTR